MPRLSDSMEEGTVLSWLKSVGDEVAVGDELVEIETDKANMVYESDTAGTLVEILAQEGATLPIGEVIARVGEAGEAVEKKSEGASGNGAAAPAEAPPPEPAEDRPPAAEREATETPSGERVKASPIARRIAQERGLDLRALQGSGPGGRIVKADVEKVQEGAEAETTPPKAQSSVGAAPASASTAPGAPSAGAPGAVASGPGDVETAKGQVQAVELSKLQSTVARRM